MNLSAVKQKLAKACIYMNMAVTGVAMNLGYAYADNPDIVTKANDIADKVYKTIVAVVLTSGGAAATVCLFLMMFSTEDQKVGSALKWLKRIVLAVAAILLMASIIRFACWLILGDGGTASLSIKQK